MKIYKATKLGIIVFLVLVLAMAGIGALNGSSLNQIGVGLLIPIILVLLLWLFLDQFSYIKITNDSMLEVKNFSPILRRGKIADIKTISKKNLYKGLPLFGKTLFVYLRDQKGDHSISINQNLYKKTDISDFIETIRSMNKDVQVNL